MAKILVTGSRGTLGTRLVEVLKYRGHDVWEVDLQHYLGDKYIRADISEYRQLERVFEQDYDYVFHLAAEFGRINGEHYYDTLWKTNVIGTRNILEWQLKKGFKLVFTSSSEIYGEAIEPLLTEDLPLKKTIIQHNDYALTKWANEVQVINFEKNTSLLSSDCGYLMLMVPENTIIPIEALFASSFIGHYRESHMKFLKGTTVCLCMLMI